MGGRPKHLTTPKKRDGGCKREKAKGNKTRFCHAGAVCRPARAQRPELKLRNTDRLSQLLPLHPPTLPLLPPYPVISLSFSPFSISSISLSSRPKPSCRFSATHSVPTPPALSGHLYLQADLCPFAAPGFFIHELIHKQHKHASGCIRMPLLLAQMILQMHSTPHRSKLILIGRDPQIQQICAVEWPLKCLWTSDR